ncbi:MAG: Rne/Rng family ribonuclease [Myxococcota bacterium]|nr:Rne/Rng family ribonuclease [Myxococcota bacterium]MDW8361890.1 Rne/Rng family ribonuclease [Myxococcales bacterium]
MTTGQSQILINVSIGETRVALVENGLLAELYVERPRERSPVGNVYLGRVTRVLPGMQAAFVDIGLDRAAFLHVEDVVPPESAERLVERVDADAPSTDDEDDGAEEPPVAPKRLTRATPIREVLKEGQPLLVQVSKGPIGTKGARVTSHVALPGRYVLYMPTLSECGVSRRIGSEAERRRLREVLETLRPPTGGILVRTIASGMTKKQLKADIGYLVTQWQETLARKERATKIPALLYEEPDIVLRTARDLFDENVAKIVVDDEREYRRLRDFVELFFPERVGDVELYRGREPFFDEHGIEDEIARALSRKVPLPSGGYLVIDQAEALTAIDVNTGRFTGKGKDHDETILQTNLEAVREIGHQLRFRNIGGLIVLDFIDMEKPAHRDRVYRALLDVLKADRAKTTVIRISELGLVEMTRKRTRESLGRTLFEPCFYCDGTGQLHAKTTLCCEIFRQMQRECDTLPGYQIVVQAHPAIIDVLEREERASVEEAARRLQRRIVLRPRRDYHLEQFDLSGT